MLRGMSARPAKAGNDRRGRGRCWAGSPAPRDSEAGLTIFEIAVAVSLLVMILLGTLASLSTGFLAQDQNSETVASQLLVQKVLEEIQDVPFETVVTFNGQYVVEGNHRADITASYVNANLVRVEVVTTSTLYPNVSTRAVTMIADRD